MPCDGSLLYGHVKTCCGRRFLQKNCTSCKSGLGTWSPTLKKKKSSCLGNIILALPRSDLESLSKQKQGWQRPTMFSVSLLLRRTFFHNRKQNLKVQAIFVSKASWSGRETAFCLNDMLSLQPGMFRNVKKKNPVGIQSPDFVRSSWMSPCSVQIKRTDPWSRCLFSSFLSSL